MTRYNCGGPGDGTRPDGNTHWDACDCRAEALRREGAARVIAWLRRAPQGETPATCADRIERGDHLRGESAHMTCTACGQRENDNCANGFHVGFRFMRGESEGG